MKATVESPSTAPADALPVATVRTTTAVARPTPRASGIGYAFNVASGGAVQGDIDIRDIKFPAMKIVQGSGKLSGRFPQGTVLLEEQTIASPPTDFTKPEGFPAFRFIPFRVQKFFREQISKADQDAGVMSRIAYSIDEVAQMGGSLGYGDGFWRSAACHHLLLEQPQGVDLPLLFDTELDGRKYAATVFYTGGGTYSDFSSPIFSACRSALTVPVLDAQQQPVKDERGFLQKRIVLWRYVWTWRLARKQAGDFWVWRPIPTLTREESSAGAVDFCQEIHQSISGVDPTAETE